MDNKKFVDTHNAQNDNSYTLALNHFGDMVRKKAVANFCDSRF